MNAGKKHFFLKLNPPRPTFTSDMSLDERTIMQNHIAYWTPYLENGTLIVFGPVLDPKGTFGMAVISVDNEAQARELANNDPAGALGHIDLFPMIAAFKEPR